MQRTGKFTVVHFMEMESEKHNLCPGNLIPTDSVLPKLERKIFVIFHSRMDVPE